MDLDWLYKLLVNDVVKKLKYHLIVKEVLREKMCVIIVKSRDIGININYKINIKL